MTIRSIQRIIPGPDKILIMTKSSGSYPGVIKVGIVRDVGDAVEGGGGLGVHYQRQAQEDDGPTLHSCSC